MPTAVFVIDCGPEERAWIESSLAGAVESIVFLGDGAELLADPPKGPDACGIVFADRDAPAALRLVRELRDTGSMLPVIVLGPHSSFREAVEIARMKATDFLERPVSVRQLRAAVRRACPEVGTS